ncbi:MAG: methyltransferase domain-containing protein [Luteolibacter sp.]
MKRYCIREDYKHGDTAHTWVTDSTDYWTDERIAEAGSYQYYVYRKAAAIAKQMPSCSFVDIGCGYPTKVTEWIAPITDDIILIDQPAVESMLTERFPQFDVVAIDLENPGDPPPISADCVVCADVIEHLLNPDPLLALVREILAVDGIAIFSTPERDITRGKGCLVSPKREHVREWNLAEFRDYLDQSGFEIVEQELLPKRRLSHIGDRLLGISQWIQKNERNSGCQMVVCRRK